MSEQETTQYDSYEADQAFAQAYYLVMGKSPPFGRNFHYQHALEDIKDTVNLLKQAVRDFEREARGHRRQAAQDGGRGADCAGNGIVPM